MNNFIDSIRDFIDGNQLQAYLIAFLILCITAIVARLCKIIIHKFVQFDGSPIPSSSILVNGIRVCIWAIGISLILSACFDVNVSGIITALGVGGIAISLGLQDTMQNFFGGLQVTLMKIIAPGDHIKVGTTEGVVTDVSWRQTTLIDFMGNTHIIPNSTMSTDEVIEVVPTNLVTCNVAIDYTGQDLESVIKDMEAAAKAAITPIVELKKDPWIQLENIQQETVNTSMRFVLADLEHVQEARDAALRAVAPYAVPPAK